MFLITPRLAGTRSAPPVATPSVQRVATQAPDASPAAAQSQAAAAPTYAPQPVATPAVYTPPRRASVELDLDAALPAASTRLATTN
jgi:hypothetical protein